MSGDRSAYRMNSRERRPVKGIRQTASVSSIRPVSKNAGLLIDNILAIRSVK
jgi:hypothetical protein